MVEGAMRLDRFLWVARLAPPRSAAQGIVADGRPRIDGRAVDRAHVAVRVGNVLTFAAFGRVRVVRIEALPARRGPVAEACACYAELGDPIPTGSRPDARSSSGPAPGIAPGSANVSHQAARD